jgi:hypothetical protein
LNIYGSDMLSEAAFGGPKSKHHLLGAWRELHQLDMFETGG